MGWGRIDDGFYDHPKVVGLSLEAIGMWTKCFSWAHRHQGSSPFPGHLPIGVPKSFGGNRYGRITKELLAANLWDSEIGGDFSIHDYAQYLPKGEGNLTPSELSEKRSNAGKRGAEARWNRQNMDAESPATPMAKPMANASEDDSKPMPPNPNPNLLSASDKSLALLTHPAVRFDDFWAQWPRKESKPAAMKAWEKAIKRAPAESIITAAREYAQNPYRPEKQFIPHPATWLNNDRWADELRGPDGRGQPRSNIENHLDTVAMLRQMEARSENEMHNRLEIGS